MERVEEGWQLVVKSILLDQIGYVKLQLRILQNEVEVFKSLIFEMEVKESLNAIYEEPEEYPTWLDNLESLKSDLEKSESERVSNESERISAEEIRQENFTEMQETVSSAVSNIKDLTDEYNENDKQKTEALNKNFEEKQKAINDNAELKIKVFDDNAEEQTKTFNTNSDDKLAEYNKNHTDKMKEFNDNFDTKIKAFDDNAATKLAEYNKNDKTKLEAYNANDKTKTDAYNANDIAKTKAYNDNTVLKEKDYNDNAADKLKEYDTNVEQKETELENLAEEKINEYNQVSAELTAKVEQVQAENESLKAENKLIKEQIPSASVSGKSIHIEDSGTLDFDWKIRGGHAQKTREGYNLLDLSNFVTQTKNGVTVVKNEDNSIKVTGTNTSDSIISFDLATTNISSGNYVVSGVLGGSSSTYKMDIAEKGVKSYASTRDGAKNFSVENDFEATAILYIYPNISVNTSIYPMLYEGTNIDKIYEQYGASPSSEFLSEVETVGSNVNELDIQNIIVGGLVNGNIVLNTISRLVTKEPILVKSSTTYNINFNELGEFKGVRIGIHSLDSEGNFLKDSGWLNFSDTKQITYTTAENCKSIRIVFSFSKTSQTVTSNTEYTEKIVLEDFYNMKFKLEKGSIATTWSPYRNGQYRNRC